MYPKRFILKKSIPYLFLKKESHHVNFGTMSTKSAKLITNPGQMTLNNLKLIADEMKSKGKLPEDYILENRVRIANSIRLYREEKGYSQDELAEIMEVNRSTISKIETGKFSITIDYLAKFSWFLEFDILLKNNKKNESGS